MTSDAGTPTLNIADRLRESANRVPFQRAVVFPAGRDRAGRVTYSQLTFRQLDEQSDQLARGLAQMGVGKGTRLVLMVRPSLEFIALTFAIFKAGATCVLIDPGMGRTNIFNCLEEIDPAGFVGIPIVHLIRRMNRKRFPNAKLNVTIGRRLLGDVVTYRELMKKGEANRELPQTTATDSAAIIFTSGSTGPPKGVCYEHGMFDAQVDLLRECYNIEPGETDLPGFPLFALFNAAMCVTTVIPDMDPTKPANVDPLKIIEATEDNGVTQAFGSPALWNTVGRHCDQTGKTFPSLRRILSAGAPVPNHVLKRMTKTLSPEADVFTPYGATECLPVASIGGREVLNSTAAKTQAGAGTCVGRTFPGVRVKIMRIVDGAIGSIGDVEELATGEIGEIIVHSPSATREYFRRADATAAAKIPDGDHFWHRMGDVGYVDSDGLLWFCGRKSHMLHTDNGPLFTIPCEAIFNNHKSVYRSALVGVGERGSQRPVIVVEPEAGSFPSGKRETQFRNQLLELGAANENTKSVQTVLFHKSLPVDTRHNVKIRREQLTPWAAEQLAKGRGQ